MKRVTLLPALIFSLLLAQQAMAQQRLVVETGHVGAVDAIAYDNHDNLLFSGGADGTIRAWNTSNHELIGVLQAGHLPVRMLAVNSSNHQIAAFETDGINKYQIVAWDWATGKRLFTHQLSETPLFLKYSPAGSYLVYGITAWKSLNFLDSSTGALLPYFQGGIGIVSDVIISNSEQSIMTYSPSGQIAYWNVDTGTMKQSYKTLPNLSAISFTPNNRYLIGAYNDSLVMVDLIGGQTVASVSLPGIINTTVDASTSEVAVYSQGSSGKELSLYDLSGGLIKMGSALDLPSSTLTDFVFARGVLFGSEQNGTLFAQQPYFSPEHFGQNNLLPIDDIAVDNHSLLLASDNHIVSFGTNFFGLTAGGRPQSVSFSTLQNPYAGATGITAIDGGRFALWNKSGPTGSYRIFTPGQGLGGPVASFPAPFLELRRAGSQLLTLDTQGSVNLLNTDSGTSTFNYTAFGLQSVADIAPQTIIAGRTQTGPLNTALLQINPTTDETVPIPDSSIVVFDLAYDQTNQILYTLDIENAPDGSTRTVLKSHQLGTLDQGTSLLTFGGEDHTAGIAVDSASNSIFTSLGFKGVNRINAYTGATTHLDTTDHIPRKLIVHGNWVISLNSDSTVSVWDRQTGKRIFDLYLFKDLSWAIVLNSGQFISSPGARQYVKVFNGMKPSSANLGNLRYQFQAP